MTDLKLLALDAEDLEVISATTQDAIVRVGDMGYAQADRRFALLMNRYAWEEPGKKGQRKRSALHFDSVQAVQAAGINLEARDGAVRVMVASRGDALVLHPNFLRVDAARQPAGVA